MNKRAHFEMVFNPRGIIISNSVSFIDSMIEKYHPVYDRNQKFFGFDQQILPQISFEAFNQSQAIACIGLVLKEKRLLRLKEFSKIGSSCQIF